MDEDHYLHQQKQRKNTPTFQVVNQMQHHNKCNNNNSINQIGTLSNNCKQMATGMSDHASLQQYNQMNIGPITKQFNQIKKHQTRTTNHVSMPLTSGNVICLFFT